MTITNHALAGVSIAVALNRPILGAIFALASHFIMDSLPHFGGVKWYDNWGKPLLIMSVIDIVLCCAVVALGIAMFPSYWLGIIVTACFATAPDWLWVFKYKFNVKHKFFDFHQSIQRYERPWGAYIEITFAVFLITFLWLIFNR